MKNFLLILFVAFNVLNTSAQKLKGTKVVTTSQKEIGNFEAIEVADNIELFLSKGDKADAEIEADDNLHEVISISENTGILRISANQQISSFKKLSVKITYTDDFKLLTAKGSANVTALTDLILTDFTIKTFDNAKIFATVKSKKFTFMANDKSKTELNVSATESVVEMNNGANLKALISSDKLTFDMYQKASAAIEGDVNTLKLRLDNNVNFVGKNLTTKNADLTTEGNSNCSIEVLEKAVISASGKSEIDLHGEQKIEINKFSDNALISKKNNKVK
ncbi:DUF2807 domain-containing protein [Flavobacterium sp. MAH-1]|uniref:DUF2807 domain-containing protein n=1 Tax=Flavobacterium agri TaxID=2743471 RepID=A0A7Y9C5J7_9FLAO|nr:DUF2807 domain-containing protein [Flavobacterium agri]NUY81046.1 DUF2807 domain-containing protein [Flavobacterium agri]NYA71070.1 DUF2807 domain-containing protein [Flavobacterium agri]